MPRMEVNVEHVAELIKLSSEMINKTDQINQRLVTAIITLSVTFCFTLVGFAYFYFTTNYEYGTVNQTQSNTENSNQKIDKGGKQ
jgi:hypothetical protein